MTFDRLRRTLTVPHAPMVVGLVAALAYAFLFARRLWFAPEVVDVVFWLAVPLGAWTGWRARATAPGVNRIATAILLLGMGYVAAAAGLFAVTALTLPLLGQRETVVVEAERWHLRTNHRAGASCKQTLVGRTPALVAGGELRFCADRFPQPIFPVPDVRMAVTRSPYVAWLHEALPVAN